MNNVVSIEEAKHQAELTNYRNSYRTMVDFLLKSIVDSKNKAENIELKNSVHLLNVDHFVDEYHQEVVRTVLKLCANNSEVNFIEISDSYNKGFKASGKHGASLFGFLTVDELLAHSLGIVEYGNFSSNVQMLDGFIKKKNLLAECYGNLPPKPVNMLDYFQSISINGTAEERYKQMKDDVFILHQLAISGQWTVFYAEPNSGKTLITLKLLFDAVESGLVDGKKVYYLNCDDTYRGATEKLQIADEAGFNTIVTGENGFTPKEFLPRLQALSESGDAKGTVFILDTLKKFVDVMSKKDTSAAGVIFRQYVSAGGSLICLSHVNKRKDEATGRSIAGGTSDIKDDGDCVYLIEVVKNEATGEKIATFHNEKMRGDNVESVSYSFKKPLRGDYRELFDSVRQVDDDEIAANEREIYASDKRDQDHEYIVSIKSAIASGSVNQKDIVNYVIDDCGLPRRKIIEAIKRWDNATLPGLWHSVPGEKRAKIFKLND